MSDNDQKVEFVNALDEAQKLDDLLASLNLKLSKIGANFAEFGKTLQGSGKQPLDLVARNFSREVYEQNYADVPALLEQYKETHAKRTELEARLRNFSWYKPPR